MHQCLKTFSILSLITLLSACGAVTSVVSKGFGNNLSAAVQNSNDPDTIRQALPSYLLTVDTLLTNSDSANLYWSGAKLNSSYASQFAVSAEQKQLLANKAWGYAQKAACYDGKEWCNVAALSQTELEALVKKMDAAQVPILFNLGSVWATWLEANSSDWNAVAQLGKIQVLMERVVQLDEKYELASAHVYIAVLDTLMPAALGGKPEAGKEHFERAITLSNGRNLMAKVLYAERYARLTFNRELHDRLLNEVIAANSTEPNWTLANTLAQQKARQLLKSADDFF